MADSTARPKLLLVDDLPPNLRMLEGILVPQGFEILTAANGREALEQISAERPDIVLTDVLMPVMDGYELCRRLRADEATRLLPVIMITASGEQEKSNALEAGADDFLVKPLNRPELVARVKSLLRVKRYQDQIEAQKAELAQLNESLADLNRTLERRVSEQLRELERLNQLRRFLSPAVAEAVLDSANEALLEDHRRQVAVVFADLRGFTAFSETAEPEEVMKVLREYHRVLGGKVQEAGGTVGFFAGDGIMVFFNDPVPCPDPAGSAVDMAVQIRREMAQVTASWQQREYELGFGVGIALGYATLGEVGFEGRFDYTAIGPVVNQAARLSGEAAPGQILISQRVMADLGSRAVCEYVADFELKGFHRAVPAYNVVAFSDAGDPAEPSLRDGAESASARVTMES
jgi:adenylate cyclase